ncbi:MAG TPA: DUF333 domain-containing protein [Candidatus Nanoarchaeia archaeon]|nr:DUF333 domain-containing protein [Candidatus Nanoarchaeia archaeon]
MKWSIFVLIALIGAIAVIFLSQGNTGLANPAAVYCNEQGGEYLTEIEANSTASFCKFPNGSLINAWDYFRANN